METHRDFVGIMEKKLETHHAGLRVFPKPGMMGMLR